jgi:hypothetical protein
MTWRWRYWLLTKVLSLLMSQLQSCLGPVAISSVPRGWVAAFAELAVLVESAVHHPLRAEMLALVKERGRQGAWPSRSVAQTAAGARLQNRSSLGHGEDSRAFLVRELARRGFFAAAAGGT